MREAPALTVIEELLAAGATVQAFDPVVDERGAPHLRRSPGPDVHGGFARRAARAPTRSLILTEWQEFRSPDFDHIKSQLSQPAIFDGRNLYNPELMKRFGFKYYGVGRGLA